MEEIKESIKELLGEVKRDEYADCKGTSRARVGALLVIAVLAVGVAVGVAVGIAIERSYWNGYDDAYNSVQAEYERGVGDGWRGCIEENNLYDRY